MFDILYICAHFSFQWGLGKRFIFHTPKKLIYFPGKDEDCANTLSQFPASATHLTISPPFDFCNAITCISSTITHLTFGGSFNQSIDNLPDSIIHLHLGTNFNYPVDHLPPHIHTLVIASVDFNQSLDNLPIHMKKLYLHFQNPNELLLYDHLPNLEVLSIPVHSQHLDHLPSTLKELVIIDIKWNAYPYRLDHLPFFLTKLVLGAYFNLPIDHLPTSLRYLRIWGKFNTPIDHLPHNLQKLHIAQPNTFDQPIDHLPPSLFCLTLHVAEYPHPLDNLPLNLQRLKLLGTFHHPIEHLPLSLRCVAVSEGACVNIPQHLRHLRVKSVPLT